MQTKQTYNKLENTLNTTTQPYYNRKQKYTKNNNQHLKNIKIKNTT